MDMNGNTSAASTPELHVSTTPEGLAQKSAEFIVALADSTTMEQKRFSIALSGGSTPRLLFKALASPLFADRIVWDQWHIFWSDERCVPPRHPDSNYRTAKEVLIDHVPLNADNVHRIKGETAPGRAAEEYEQVLRREFQQSSPIFDLILLGLGKDGHTASLFSGTSALEDTQRLVAANWVPRLKSHRVTFTLRLINAASTVVFLVADGSKAGIVQRVLEPTSDGELPPAALVRPKNGRAHWFLTNDAASQI
jgi:6-phosphogluconolactonase